MTCDPIRENLELYALGALESSEAREVEDHLAAGCPACRAELDRALQQNLLVARTVPLVDPPARLRQRLKEALTPHRAPRRRYRWAPWSLLAAAAVLALVLGVNLRNQLRRETDVARVQSADRARLLKTLEIVRAPGTREVTFRDAAVPAIHGVVYVHQKLGLALVIDRLPHAPPGWKFESWTLSKEGLAQPVESVTPSGDGRAVSVVPGPIDLARVDGLAISMEPENSRPVKPTKLLFSTSI